MAAIGGVGDPAPKLSNCGEHRLEPIHVKGVIRLVLQGLQHSPPSGELHPGAAVQAPQRPFDPRPVAGGQLVGLVVQ